MRVLVTGAGGHIGSAVVAELLDAGHHVVGLARSAASAATVTALGAEVRRGDLSDLDGVRVAADDADAVIHLAFNHDAMRAGDFASAATEDLAVVRAFGDALAGTGKAFIGVGRTATGVEAVDAAINANPRHVAWREIAGLADRDVRAVLVAIPPVVHGTTDHHGFVPTLIGIARAKGVSGYVNDGANRWAAAHTLDVAHLYRLVLENAPAGAQLSASAEDGIATRAIAEAIGRHLDVPAVSVPADRAAGHFGFFTPMASIDVPMASDDTRRLLDWRPTRRGLLADLDAGHYFTGR